MTRIKATFASLIVLSAILANTAAGQEPQMAERVEIQFRDGIAKHPTLRFIGADVEPMAVVQPQGLRFNVPAGRASAGDVGIEAQQRLHGDFEITLAYELVALPKPAPKLGAGAVLQIVLDGPGAPTARMDRLHRATDDVFGANCILNGDFQGLAVQPADDKLTNGQLRMVRTGAVLTYLVQEGSGGFNEIAAKQIGQGDVIAVQALCATGWQPVALGVRFPRLEMRSGKAGGAIDIGQAPAEPIDPQTPAGGGWAPFIVLGLCTTFSLAAIAGILIFLWKRGIIAVAGTNVPTRPAHQPAIDVPTRISFPCSGCGKTIRAKAELQGKKVKCPHCGEPILFAKPRSTSPPPA